MFNNTSPVALIMPNQQDTSIFMQGLAECGFRKITVFNTSEEAYRVCSRQQFPLFITRMEMPDMSGIVMLQKLRMTGNYGVEPHLFVCDKLIPTLLNVITEYDLDYVLTAPFTKQSVAQKFKHLIDTENNLSEIEQSYRDAKAAYRQGIFDMAENFAQNVLNESPDLEKAKVLLGDIKMKNKDLNGAEVIYKEVLAKNPKSTNAMHKLAQLMLARGEYNVSADLLNRLADVSPHNIKLLENAGLSNFEAERFDQAAKHMSKLSTIDESNKIAATVTANVKIKIGDYAGLVDVLRKCHDDRELIQFFNNAGAKLSRENDTAGALKMYRAALEQIGDSPYLYAIHYNMGIAYKRLGNEDEAVTHLEKSLKIKPDFDKAVAAMKDIKRKTA